MEVEVETTTSCTTTTTTVAEVEVEEEPGMLSNYDDFDCNLEALLFPPLREQKTEEKLYSRVFGTESHAVSYFDSFFINYCIFETCSILFDSFGNTQQRF